MVLVACCVAAAVGGIAAELGASEGTHVYSSGGASWAGAGRGGVDVALESASARRQKAAGVGGQEEGRAEVRTAWWDESWAADGRWSWDDQDSGHAKDEQDEEDDDNSVLARHASPRKAWQGHSQGLGLYRETLA